ncbi:MAG TPA: hypothetical protein VLF59_02955, partial [Candidatus Saccharimonadales bacterium]|nr:hypothetical protein [Candidatus Saccharimonadales bacterium]
MKQKMAGQGKRWSGALLVPLRLMLVLLVVATCMYVHTHKAAATVAACSTSASTQNGISVAPSHGSAFYIDTGASPKLDAGYIGYRVTNSTGSAQSDLWTEVGSFTGGDLQLANSLDNYRQVSSLSNGSTAASYFLLKASSATTTPQTHRVKVWDGRPDLPTSSVLYDCLYTFSAVKETIKAAANKVSDTGYGTTAAIEVSNTSPTLGQTVTITVEGQTGTIGAGSSPDGSIVWLTPAAVSSWPTRSLRLESVSATFERNTNASKKWTVNGDQVTYANQLLITNAQNCLKQSANASCTGGTGSTSAEYRATYTFRVVGIPTSSVQAVPVAQIASGTQIKHADTTATGATVNLNFSSVSINASLTKNVTSTTGLSTVTCSSSCVVPGGTNGTTYTAVPYRLTAASTNSTAVTLDEIVDQPQTGVIYKTGTARITDIGRTSTAIDDPSYLSSEASLNPRPLHFVGPFNFSLATSAYLDYQMWVPTGAYTNTAYAKLGDLLIGANASAMSKVIITPDGSGTIGVSVTTESLGVIVTTMPATSITSSAATINGTVDPNGTTPLTGTFQYSTAADLTGATTVTATTPSSGTLSGLTDPTNTSYSLSGLTANTTYYYRAVAGTAQGDILSFTTNAVLAAPTVATTAASTVTSTGATLNGTINPNLTSILAIQFIYGTSSSLASGNTTVTLDDGSGANLTASGASLQPFSSSVSALTNGTTYYYKIRACTTSNCSSFVDGSILNFVAQNPPSNPVLSVSKTEDDADNVVTPGQAVTYTVGITNSGGLSGATSFTDTIPTGMGTPSNFTYTNCGTPSSGYSAPTLTVSSLSIDTVNICIVTYSVAVNSPLNEGTTLTNSVDVAAASQGGNNPAAVAASTLTVDATPNLSTSTKTVSDLDGGTVLPGDTLRYTITAINTGNGQATGVAITDTIDTDTQNLTNVSRSNCGSSTNSSTGTQLNVTGATVQIGTNCVITFDVSVKSPLTVGTSLSNTASIGAATEGGVGATPSSSTLLSAAPPSTPNLVITHSEDDADDTVFLNQTVGYTITIENNGGADGSSIAASSTLASDSTLNTGSFGYANCGTPGNTSTASSLALNSIAVTAGQTCTITYTASIKNTANSGDSIASSVDVGQATEGGNNPAPVSATTLSVLIVDAPSGLKFTDGATNLSCSGTTGNRSMHLSWTSVSGAADYQVSLDGGSATSTSGNATYDWTMPAADGVHTFKVRAIDGASNTSVWSSTCQVTLDQTAPTVDAGTDQTTGNAFTQTSSSASDGGSGIATYSWAKVSGPGTLSFDDATLLHPQISASADGVYVVRLTVTDAVGNSASDTFTLTWDHTGPAVDAGTDKTARTSFTQTSATSTDAGAGIAGYAWTKVSGPGTITFTNASDLHPQISASADGTYVIRLTATDNTANSASDTFTLVWDSTAPTVDAGIDQTTGSSFTQSSSSATDSGSGIASYAWAKVSGPGTLTFNNTTSLHPQISASSDGTYVLRLSITDNAGNSASDTFTLVWDTSVPPPPTDDNDGATPTEEQAAPNSGDANDDGTTDADESTVTSFVNPITSTYAVLENTSGCQNTDVTQLAVASLAQTDGSYNYPAGLMNFKLICSGPGATAHVNQYFYGVDATQLVARKYDTRTHTYTTIPGAVIT